MKERQQGGISPNDSLPDKIEARLPNGHRGLSSPNAGGVINLDSKVHDGFAANLASTLTDHSLDEHIFNFEDAVGSTPTAVPNQVREVFLSARLLLALGGLIARRIIGSATVP